MIKKHISEIDFIRVICALGIIVYHFSCETSGSFKPFYKFANGNYGITFVTVFFIVSGFVLYHSNQEIKSLKEFYYKRFKSIFPMFWLCWFTFYVINVIKVRIPFYAGNPIKILLSLIGMDGYLGQRIVTYYTVGEWFIGALIIVYLLYPLLLKCFKRNEWLGLIVLLALLTIEKILNVPTISPGFPGIVESCLKLYIGMFIYKHQDLLKNRIIVIVSCVYYLIYAIVNIPVLNTMLNILHGMALFVILFNIGSFAERNNNLSNSFNSIGNLTYPMFLLQHQVILYVLMLLKPNGVLLSIAVIILCILLTIIVSYVVDMLIKKLFSSKLYNNFENNILN